MDLTIKEYMEVSGIKSNQTVYNRIKKGAIKSYTKNGRRFIIADDDSNNLENYKQESLKKEIEYLKNQKKEQEFKIEILEKKLEEKDNILVNEKANLRKLSNTIQQLEYKKQEVEQELQEEKNKKWWQKIFTKN